MPFPHTLSRTLAAATVLVLASAVTAPAQAQHPGIDTAPRAFWGIPVQPPQRSASAPASFVQTHVAPAAHHHPHHGVVLPQPVVEVGVAPSPYPYGYFGASGTRHWQRHFGYRNAYTQWTLK